MARASITFPGSNNSLLNFDIAIEETGKVP